METLFQLIHVSDLHFGDTWDAGTPIVSTATHIAVRIPGLEIHDTNAIEALSNSVHWVRLNATVPTCTLITGDLTTFGTDSAFDLSSKYLTDYLPKMLPPIGFGDPDLSIVPGNHDIWGGATLDPVSKVTQTVSTRPLLHHYFNLPSAFAAYPASGAKFPYRLRLYDAPLIYLYGLDSTRIDLCGNPSGLLDDGYLDSLQLADLADLIRDEPHQPQLRIAALHHPPTIPKSATLRVTKGSLIDADQAFQELKRLGFSLALCGHLHEEFSGPTKQDPTKEYRPVHSVHVLAAGSSAQKVNLSPAEKKALTARQGLVSVQDWKLRQRAMRLTNDYRVYQFMTNLQEPDSLYVAINTYLFVPQLAAFEQQTNSSVVRLR